MNIEQAFEIVAKIIHDRGVELIVGGNPAFETEFVLFHIESTMLTHIIPPTMNPNQKSKFENIFFPFLPT